MFRTLTLFTGGLLVATFTNFSALAATLTVTSASDDGSGTLRQIAAIAQDGDDIKFAPSLDGNTITLNNPIRISFKDVNIMGRGMMQTMLSGTNGVFIFDGDGTAKISNLSFVGATAQSGGAILIMGGRVEVQNSAFTDNSANGAMANMGGGAIANRGGSLYVKDVTFSGNDATGTSGSGGAIINTDGGSLEIVSSTFTGNTAQRAGGAVEDASGNGSAVTFFNVDFKENVAGTNPGNGGAFHITGNGDASISGGVADGNVAAREGGAFWNGAGEMRISNVQITNNTASGAAATQGGGGVFNLSGSVIITGNTKITGNVANGASGSGGGILNGVNGMLGVYGTEISGNSAMRAGGGIEDFSGDSTTLKLAKIVLKDNTTGSAPGNGGGLHISGNGNVEFHGGTVTGNVAASEGGGLWNGTGKMLLLGTVVRFNTAEGDAADNGGGGVFNNGGFLEIQNRARISDNSATGASGSGGGIFNADGGQLKVVKSLINRNKASRAGGGVEDASGSSTEITFYEVTFNGNSTGSAPGNGGALHITGDGDAQIFKSVVVENTAASEGGGLWNGNGKMYIDDTAIERNVASGDAADNGGGGIYNLGGDVVIVNNTSIGDNVADGTSGSGGGILNEGKLLIFNSVIDSNKAMRAGGGIETVGDGRVELYNVIGNENVASANPGNGGFLHVTGAGRVKVSGGSYSRNVAAREGGAFWNGSGNMTISDVSIGNNVASGDAADDGGGGIFNQGGFVFVKGGTRIDNNVADGASGSGGGIFNNSGGTIRVEGGFITFNSANRAGGGIEDQSNTDDAINLIDVVLNENTTGSAPGNGGGLHVTGTGDVTIKGGSVFGNTAASEGGGLWNGSGTMTISDDADVSSNVASGDLASNGGGGIFNQGGQVFVFDSRVVDNVADGASGSGGGFFNETGGSLTIERTNIFRNSASRAGGGIEDNSGAGSSKVRLRDVNLSNNSTGSTPGNGGGLHVTGAGNVRIVGGRVAGNTATAEGGGLWNGAGRMDITQVQIENNTASGAAADNGGGGVFNNGGTVNIYGSTLARNSSTGALAGGGGLYNGAGGTAFVTVSTVSNNTSANNAAGIANAGTLTVTASTVARNSAASMGGGIGMAPGSITTTLRSSIVANNSAPNRGPNVDAAGGAYLSEGYNIVMSDPTGIFPDNATDKEGVDPLLDALGNYGGKTLTHQIGCLSPAIGMGDPSFDVADQRGRMIIGTRDIGSYERRDGCADDGFTTNEPNELASNFEVFPTVTRGEDVSLRVLADESGQTVNYQLLDSRGQVLRTLETASNATQISLSGLLPGTYYVRRTTASGTETKMVNLIR